MDNKGVIQEEYVDSSPNMPKTPLTDAVIATNMLPCHGGDNTIKKTQQKKVLSVLLTFFEIGV